MSIRKFNLEEGIPKKASSAEQTSAEESIPQSKSNSAELPDSAKSTEVCKTDHSTVADNAEDTSNAEISKPKLNFRRIRSIQKPDSTSENLQVPEESEKTNKTKPSVAAKLKIERIAAKKVTHEPKSRINVRRINHSQLQKHQSIKSKLTRISDLNLEQLVSKAKEIHPLPRERQMKINPTHRNWLIAQLRKANTDDKLQNLAYSLNHQELSLLFPVLATTRKPISIERLKTVINLRASKTLYYHGWITWQFIYPDNRLAKTLADLCKILTEQRLPSEQQKRERFINQEYTSLLPYPHFNWTEISLISDIIMPDNRRFMNNVTNYLIENDITLDDFYAKYAIYDDLALGEAIKANYQVERIEHTFKSQNQTNESFSWQDFFGLNNKSDFIE